MRKGQQRLFMLLVSCLLWLFMANTAHALTAEKVADFGDVLVLEVDGNYDAHLAGGYPNSEAREEIAKEFFKSRPDDYDFLFVFTNFDFKLPDEEVVAFYQEVRNDVSGIGKEIFDNSWLFGSNGRLQGTIDMGNLSNWATDPMDKDFSFLMGTMSHELMHRWGSFVHIQAAGEDQNLLGRDDSHWSFLLDTKGSLMYGNPWQDNGDGTYTSLKGRKYYCPLDLYLMGLIDKTEVPPMLLIDSPGTDRNQVSKPGITISGTPAYVTIDDIIAVEGERFPNHLSSQKTFKIACIFATRPGTFTGDELPVLRTIINNWAIWHSGLTDGRSTIEYQYSMLESLPFNPGPDDLPHQPRPTPVQVEEAIAWLIEQQSDDGSWSDSENTTERDSAAALKALKPFSQAETNIASALQWIRQNGIQAGTDYLARQMEALAVSNAPIEDFNSELFGRQNLDGAWGPDTGYVSSPTDTALVLRALMAAGQLSAPKLSEAVNFLKLNQNLDGGWGGGPQASDIQTTANVLLAFAPLRVPYELNLVVQQGLAWIYQQQRSDGGFGEDASTIYDTAAVLMVLKRYDGDPQYFGPAIEYIQTMQSINGSWHSSVYETALAAEALYVWKDSVDADLSIITSDITFSPGTITQNPQTVTVDVIVHNNGLATADGFNVALYGETISAGTVLDSQRLTIAGQTTATVQFTVSFSDTQDHRLFVVADTDNEVIETNEANNTALAILLNDMNMDPDLQIRTDDMFFTPAGISQMPAAITLDATVFNTGMTDVAAVTAVLYQDLVNDSAKIAERQFSVPAQSSTTLSIDFTVLDGDTHRYYLVVDPADQVAERNEYNNTAIKQLTSNPAYDFGLRTQDLSTSASTVEMGQQLTVTAVLRNYGNRDGYNVPARFYIENEGLQYDIATLPVDLPAGGQIELQVPWTADRAGTDMQVVCQLDPFNAFAEVSEANNAAATTLTVNPYPDPNLLLNHQGISITPTPVHQGASATITATIANTGGGQATDVHVQFSWFEPGQAPQPLGSSTIAVLAPGQSVQAQWVIDQVDVSGIRHIQVTADPDNTIAEVFEEDNSAFVEVDILGLPDFVIEAGSIRFNPPAPADGETVRVTVSVQNAGRQSAQNVPVVLSEGGQQIAQGVIANIAGNAQAEIAFDYDTTGKSGIRYLDVAVDPNRTIAEQKTDNNTARRTLGVQNSDLWLSQNVISANGNPDQFSTTLFFRLDGPSDVEVVVVNEKGEIVRSFNGEELEQTTGGSITWDGRNERGVLVPDGVYQIQVRDLLGNVLLGMSVTVDNNLSALVEAAGTEFLSTGSISCHLPYIHRWQWFSDESGIIFMVSEPDDDVPAYPPGVYTMTPSGSGIQPIVPSEWMHGTDPDYDYTFEDISLSPDDNTVAVIVSKRNRNGYGDFSELWSMDRFGNNRTLIDTFVHEQEDGTWVRDYVKDGIYWSDDGARFAYIAANGGTSWGQSVRLSRPDGSDKVSLPFNIERAIFEFHWAPDGQHFSYILYDQTNQQESCVVGDLSGQLNELYTLPAWEHSAFHQWIDARHFVFTHDDDQQNRGVVVVVDALNGQVLEEFNNVLESNYATELKIRPGGGGFALSSAPNFYQDGNINLQYCDMNGACETLHQRPNLGYSDGFEGLNWSPQGDRLAVVDAFYEKTGDDEYAGHLVVIDWPSLNTKTHAVEYPNLLEDSTPYSFHIYTQQGDLWVEQGELHYGSNLETKTLSLPALTPDDQGHAVLRIVQSGTDQAHVDAVALRSATESFLPVRATVVATGGDILQSVMAPDGLLASVAGESVAYEWENLPAHTPFTLEMHANEANSVDGDAGSSTSEQAQAEDERPYAPMEFDGREMSWFNDGQYLLSRSNADGVFAFDSETGEKTLFNVDWRHPRLSPLNRYITSMEWDRDCNGQGYSLMVLKSLLNLTAELKVVRKESYLEIRGTATDRNFADYRLEYADTSAPDQWRPIRPPVETMVIDDVMADWVPPQAGIYTVRLTVTDQAGHTAVASRRVSWGLDSPIADLYLEDTYISPNGDGVKDAMRLHYTVHEPVNLEFYVYSQQTGQPVATLLRSYTALPANDGRDVLMWDGRDDRTGETVPDGAYHIEVLGYAFAFVVDTTPPDVDLALMRIESSVVEGEIIIEAKLNGFTLDDNFSHWTIEHGEGVNPQTWQVLISGKEIFGINTDSPGEPETIHSLQNESLGAFSGNKFRITVEDKAGNRSTATTEILEELLVIYNWDAQGLGTKDISVRRREDGSFPEPSGDELPVTLLRGDHRRLKMVNTVRKPVGMVLQYRIGMNWVDGLQSQGVPDNSAVVEFPGEIAELDSVNAVRVKVTDGDGTDHYSNAVSTRQILGIDCVLRNCTLPIKVYPFEDLDYLALYADSEDNIIHQWDTANGQTVPLGDMALPIDCDYFLTGGKFGIIGVGLSGKQYRFSKTVQACKGSDDSAGADTGSSKLVVTYAKAAACNTLSPGTVRVTANLDDTFRKNATKLAYYLRLQDGTSQLLREYDLATESWGSAELDTNAAGANGLPIYEEGFYPVEAVVTIVDNGVQSEQRINRMQKSYETGNPEDRALVSARIVVDRTLPQGAITSPAAGAVICPRQLGDKLVVDLAGTAHDSLLIASYNLQYGYGHSVADDAWHTMSDIYGHSLKRYYPVAGGSLGTWDVTHLIDRKVTVRLTIHDVAGNRYCVSQPLVFNTGFQLIAAPDIKQFSPNGDGELDSVTIRYTLDHAADLTVTALQQGAAVKTIATGVSALAGEGEFIWDGTDSSGQWAADGSYTIRVAATDSCNNVKVVDIEDVVLDRTPPTVLITYPQATDQLGIVAEVLGTAEDPHFSGYRMEILDETDPEPLQVLAESNDMVKDGILGRWNTFGVDGVRLIRLSAWDTLGNTAEQQVRIDLGQRSNLITALAADPDLFSPNNDAQLEQTVLNFSLNSALNQNYNTTLELLSETDQVVRTFSQDDMAGGAGAFTWDGRDSGGQMAADGVYRAVLTAALVSNPSITHQEQVTIILDAVAPQVLVTSPQDQAFVNGPLTIQGTIDDAHIEHYRVTLDGADGERLLDEGSVSRYEHTFTGPDELADGPYSLTVQARDRGQIETRIALTITVDKTAPKLTLSSPVSGDIFGNKDPHVDISGMIEEDNLAQWQLRYRLQSAGPDQWAVIAQGDSLAGGAIEHQWPVGPDDLVPDGRYILSLYAMDHAGWDTEATANIVIDNTAPLAAITTPASGGYIKTPTAIVGSAADENLTAYRLEFANGTCEEADRWSRIGQSNASVQNADLARWMVLPPDGDYCLRLTVEDAASHTAAVRVPVSVDTQPPAPVALNGWIEDLSHIRLTWTASDDAGVVGYNLYRDGQKLNTELIAGTQFDDADMVPGTYAYTVHAVDRADWQSEPSNELILDVDLTPPSVRIGTPRQGDVVADLVNIEGMAFSKDDFKEYRLLVGQGADPVQWQLIHQSAVPTSYGRLAQWDCLALNSGELYTIKLEAEDIAGNIGEHRISVTIDNQAPAPPVLMTVAAQPQPGNTIDVTWQANSEPDLAGYLLYRNGVLANASTEVAGELASRLIDATTYTDAALFDGTYEYYLLAMDNAGNLSAPSNTLSTTIDLQAPHAVISDPQPSHQFDRTLMIQAVSLDQDIASVQIQYKAAAAADYIDLGSALNSRPYVTSLDPIALGLAFGQYHLRAVATDVGGRTDSQPGGITVEYRDVTPPAAPVDVQSAVDGGRVTLTWTANSESDLAGYNIYQVGSSGPILLNAAPVPEPTYIVGEAEDLPDGDHLFQVFALDTTNNRSRGSEEVGATVHTPLLEQPYTPTQLEQYSFYGETRPGETVEVFNDTGSGPQSVVTVAADGQGRFFCDVVFSPGWNEITVRSTDDQGNISKASAPVMVTYVQPPTAPTGLAGEVTDHDVALSWNPNPESDLAGYNVYRDGQRLNADVAVTGGTATASVYGYMAAYAVDGSPDSSWRGYVDATGTPIWWQYDIGQTVLVNRLTLEWNNPNGLPDSYELQAWTGQSWVPVIRVMGNTQTSNAFTFASAYPTDRIRLVIAPDAAGLNTGWHYLAEFKLWRLDPHSGETYSDLSVPDGRHSYHLEAVNTMGLISDPSQTLDLDVGDVTPPDAPVLTAGALGSAITLNWTPSGASDLAGYRIYKLVGQTWQVLAQGPIAAVDYTDSDLRNGTYTYRVTAIDLVGNESAPSNEASAVVNEALLARPQNVGAVARPQGGAIEVCWDAVPGAAGYRLYRSLNAGGPYDIVTDELISDTCYLDTGLQDGLTYYYIVRAVDALSNESPDSDESTAVPEDLTAPDAPVLYAPTVTGRPISVAEPHTHILGWAEPGAEVALLHQGEPVYGTTADWYDMDSAVDLGLSQGQAADQWAVSDDGRLVAVAGYDSNASDYACRIIDLDNGDQATLYGWVSHLSWSAENTRLVYTQSTGYGDRVVIYNWADRNPIQVSDGQGLYSERTPSWNADGTLLFVSNQSGYDRIMRYDPSNGQTTALADVSQAQFPKLSADGRYVAYLVGSDLYYIDLQAGGGPVLAASALWQDANESTRFDWTADSARLVYLTDTGGMVDLLAFSPADLTTQDLIVTGDLRNFQILPGGRHVIYLRDTGTGIQLWMGDLDGRTARRLDVDIDGEGPDHLAVTDRGSIAYLSDRNLRTVLPAGRFEFPFVDLTLGENRFTATAQDAAGNTGSPSDAILIVVDETLLPDIEIAAGDLYSYPYVPIDGDQVEFSVVVSNNGFVEAQDINVFCYLLNPDSSEELVYQTTIDRLAAGDQTVVQFAWDSTGRPGGSELIVEADPKDLIFESYEYNNYASLAFYVAATEGLAMETKTLFDLYFANEPMDITLNLYNSGREQNVSLTVDIVDENYQPIANVAQAEMTLPYTPKLTGIYTWNTGTTLAGSYYIRSILTDDSGQLTQNLVPFTIEADMELETQLVTDRAAYGPRQTVQLHGAVTSRAENMIFSGLSVEIVLRNGLDEIVHAHSVAVPYLYGSTPIAVDTSWPTAQHAPGTYTATLTVLADGLELAKTSREFTVESEYNLSGSLSLQPALTSSGTPVSVDYAVTLYGNTALTGAPISIVLMDPQTQTDLDADQIVADIELGGTVTGIAVFDTQTLADRNYAVQLRCWMDGASVVLGESALTIRSQAQTPVEMSGSLTADPQSATMGDEIVLRYTLTNAGNIHLDDVRLQIDVPAAAQSNFQQSLSLPAGLTVTGEFVLPTQALIPDTYAAMLLVDLPGMQSAAQVADTTFVVKAPVTYTVHEPVAVPGGPYLAAVGEAVQLDGSGSFDLDQGTSESGEPPFDQITAYGWETDMIEPHDFDDAADATIELPGFDEAGVYAIGLQVTDNTALAFPSEGSDNLAGRAFDELAVHTRAFDDLAVCLSENLAELSWSQMGAAEYEVLRSELGPNRGFGTIAVTAATAVTDDSRDPEKTYWYRVRAVVGNETVISVAVVEACVGDQDGDGVIDSYDACPDTEPGVPVDAYGCGGEQLVDATCPCEQTPPWTNHGQYMKCVVHAAKDQLADGLITRQEKHDIIRERARSDCGKPEHVNDQDGDGVPNASDQCPWTAPGAVVDDDGCSAEQQVDRECPYRKIPRWKSHDNYMKCVKYSARDLWTRGFITRKKNCKIVERRKKSR